MRKQYIAPKLLRQVVGQAIDGVITPTVLQGQFSAVTDLVSVSRWTSGLSVNGELVSSIQVLSSLSKLHRL